MRRIALLSLAAICLTALTSVGQVGHSPKEPPPLPPARPIPGITAEDRFPNGCVDCHLNYQEMNLDTRFSTLMAQWTKEVEPRVMDKAKAAAPQGLTLSGKHPAVNDFSDVPKSCLTCHQTGSTVAPAFSRMLHAIHLGGGEQSHFMTMFQGECTHCHKLNPVTGEWAIASGKEH